MYGPTPGGVRDGVRGARLTPAYKSRLDAPCDKKSPMESSRLWNLWKNALSDQVLHSLPLSSIGMVFSKGRAWLRGDTAFTYITTLVLKLKGTCFLVAFPHSTERRRCRTTDYGPATSSTLIISKASDEMVSICCSSSELSPHELF